MPAPPARWRARACPALRPTRYLGARTEVATVPDAPPPDAPPPVGAEGRAGRAAARPLGALVLVLLLGAGALAAALALRLALGA